MKLYLYFNGKQFSQIYIWAVYIYLEVGGGVQSWCLSPVHNSSQVLYPPELPYPSCLFQTTTYGVNSIVNSSVFSFFQRCYKLFSAQWCSSQMVNFLIKLFGNYSLWYVSDNNLLKVCDIYWDAKFWSCATLNLTVLSMYCPTSCVICSLQVDISLCPSYPSRV